MTRLARLMAVGLTAPMAAQMLAAGLIDLVLGILFVVAFLRTAPIPAGLP